LLVYLNHGLKDAAPVSDFAITVIGDPDNSCTKNQQRRRAGSATRSIS